MERLSVGDIIVGTQSHNKDIVRGITEVRKTGYTWKYPDIEDKYFHSEDSTDPFFECGWEKVKESNLPLKEN